MQHQQQWQQLWGQRQEQWGDTLKGVPVDEEQ
jgi:hypothetical protein